MICMCGLFSAVTVTCLDHGFENPAEIGPGGGFEFFYLLRYLLRRGFADQESFGDQVFGLMVLTLLMKLLGTVSMPYTPPSTSGVLSAGRRRDFSRFTFHVFRFQLHGRGQLRTPNPPQLIR